MKRILLGAIIFLLTISTYVYAQLSTTTEKASFPPVNWVSKNSSDDVVIHNGNGSLLMIEIDVNNNQTSDAPGINLKNCGTTSHAKAGSSAICTTNDPTHPVTFSSDSSTTSANGTYQIKQE